MVNEPPTRRVEASFAGPAPARRVRLASGVRGVEVAREVVDMVIEARLDPSFTTEERVCM
jgi:hypothetical protein